MAEYNSYNNGKKGGRAWLWATLVLVAFIGGVLLSQGVDAFKRANEPLPTALEAGAPTQAPAQTTAQPTQTPYPAATTAQPTQTPGGYAQATAQAQLQAQISSVADVVDRVAAAVVGINNNINMTNRFDFSTTEVTQSSGSGVIISADGYIITNEHVIDAAEKVLVILEGGEEVEAQVVGYDTRTDLALLKIDRSGLSYMPIGDSSTLRVGDFAIAIGNPLGHELAGTVTLGIVSAVNREVTDTYGLTNTMIQTDAAINPGNSGGALVNLSGELVGINTSKSTLSGTSYAEGIGFAIPSSVFTGIIDLLKANGKIDRPYLGIGSLQEITERQAQYNQVPQGVYVGYVGAATPAQNAGLQKNDIITAFNGAEIKTVSALKVALDGCQIGQAVQMDIYRMSEDKTYTLTVILQAQGGQGVAPTAYTA